MKRALLTALLLVGLSFGNGIAYAFPNGPCMPTASQSAASGISQVQVFLLLLPALSSPII